MLENISRFGDYAPPLFKIHDSQLSYNIIDRQLHTECGMKY